MREEISRIDESWAAARFDSLPHVVHILTSKDREGEVQFLKEQSDIIEEVVDEVVHAYHSGFNKAIQNYSQVSENFLLDCYNYTRFPEFSSSFARVRLCVWGVWWGGGGVAVHMMDYMLRTNITLEHYNFYLFICKLGCPQFCQAPLKNWSPTSKTSPSNLGR